MHQDRVEVALDDGGDSGNAKKNLMTKAVPSSSFSFSGWATRSRKSKLSIPSDAKTEKIATKLCA
jgi:hypothetical protein